MNAAAPWRTVLIESQMLLRNALAKAIGLDDRFEPLAEREDGVEGKETCLRLNPDLVVMDICLPR
jgi:chemotaxis response regulator CheB